MLRWWRDTPEHERVLCVAFMLFVVMFAVIAVDVRRQVKERRAAQVQGEQQWPATKQKP